MRTRCDYCGSTAKKTALRADAVRCQWPDLGSALLMVSHACPDCLADLPKPDLSPLTLDSHVNFYGV